MKKCLKEKKVKTLKSRHASEQVFVYNSIIHNYYKMSCKQQEFFLETLKKQVKSWWQTQDK